MFHCNKNKKSVNLTKISCSFAMAIVTFQAEWLLWRVRQIGHLRYLLITERRINKIYVYKKTTEEFFIKYSRGCVT